MIADPRWGPGSATLVQQDVDDRCDQEADRQRARPGSPVVARDPDDDVERGQQAQGDRELVPAPRLARLVE
jgi:hypothetical protein